MYEEVEMVYDDSDEATSDSLSTTKILVSLSTKDFWSSTVSYTEQVLLNFNDSFLVSGIQTTKAPIINGSSVSATSIVFDSGIIIPLYVVIFLLAVIGNSLVLVTLAQNKRMRTVTNVYLLNLAVSDLLLGVFCMPITLVGQVLRNFIFGAAMCKMIPYFQAVSVSVGVWTLVAISLERYFAICSPLKSRRWQTQFHAYKMIIVVWSASLIWSVPILIVSRLKTMKDKEKHKCREEWPSSTSEKAYNLFLDAMLLLVPLVIMTVAYSLIVSKLWKGLRREIQHNSSFRRQLERTGSSATVNEVVITNANGTTSVVTPLRQNRPNNNLFSANHVPPSVTGANLKCNNNIEGSNGVSAVKHWLLKGIAQVKLPKSKGAPGGVKRNRYGKLTTNSINNKTTHTLVPPEASRLINGGVCNADDVSTKDISENNSLCGDSTPESNTNLYVFNRHAIRSNYMDKSIEAKKKVIRMLFVIVAEFFVCWAPLHVLNTWYLFSPEAVYNIVGSTGISLVQLLAYISSCCNPITYCFMHRKFRQAFLSIFDCFSGRGECPTRMTAARGDQGGAGGLVANNSDISGNDSTVYVGRASTAGRSEVVVLEAEDRV